MKPVIQLKDFTINSPLLQDFGHHPLFPFDLAITADVPEQKGCEVDSSCSLVRQFEIHDCFNAFSSIFLKVRMREHLAKRLSTSHMYFWKGHALVKNNEAACNPCESIFPTRIRDTFA
jgi:hypothetical protein